MNLLINLILGKVVHNFSVSVGKNTVKADWPCMHSCF